MKEAKNIDFYHNVIINYKLNLNYNYDAIENFPSKDKWDLRPERVSQELSFIGLKLSTFTLKLLIIIASYSRGDDKNELKKQFSEAVLVMEKVWDKKITKVYHGVKQIELDQYKFEPYLHMLQMMSLGILLDVPDSEFNKLIVLIDQDNIKDFLYEFLISSRIKDRKPILEESYKRYLLIPKLYGKLVAIANNNDHKTAVMDLKKYLEKDWIKVYKNYYIDFNLKDIEKYDVNSGFTGIWAFEVAAIVKIKQLEDSSFKDNVFYPDRF